MIQLVLDDSAVRRQLFPFTLTRSAADIRIGILTIRQKWEKILGIKVRVSDDAYLDSPMAEKTQPVIFAANIVPSRAFVNDLLSGQFTGEAMLQHADVRVLERPWHIFEYNDWAIRQDY